jgi:D-glycero-alpha-D-manno-heptose-7-phosphate kinase
MIISRTPLRVSLIGGGSDIPQFYKRHQGQVVSTGINKYVYVMAHPFFKSNQILLKYSKTELANRIDDIQHPLFRESLRFLGITGGLEITTNADVPTGTGLGSSSSFAVGLLNCLYTYQGKHAPKERLAKEACHIEMNVLKEPIGKQDQYAAAYGNLNSIEFFPDESVSVSQIIMSEGCRKELNDNLIMFYTGISRDARDILHRQTSEMENSLKIRKMIELTELAKELKQSLKNNDLSKFGEILNKGWEIKKNMSDGISTPLIETYYAKALKNGALGGKLLGAGGGGFLLFYADKNKHARLRESFSDLVELPIKFDYEGTKIIYANVED